MAEMAELRFDPGSLDLAEIRRLATDMWSDIAFDEAALARLKRDGLMLDGARLTGPSPFRLDSPDGQQVRVRVDEGASAALMLDLWLLHFAKGLRPGSIAA